MVLYVGEKGLPEMRARRLRDREGICYGWAHDRREAEVMAERARREGKLNVIIAPVHERRQLAPKPKGIQYKNLPHEYTPSVNDCRLCEPCGRRFDDGPHEP